jgi:hypothetical protein
MQVIAIPVLGARRMKVKLAVAFAVLLFAFQAHADSMQLIVDVTATSCVGCFTDNPPPINLVAQFTVEQATGTFFDSGEAYLFNGTEYEVVGISGTLNGDPMALAAAPQGIGSWLYELNGEFELGSVYFTADGSFSWLENDDAFNLLEISDANGDGYGTNNAINWSATDPPSAPEPSSLLLSGMGLATLIGRVRRSRTKS